MSNPRYQINISAHIRDRISPQKADFKDCDFNCRVELASEQFKGSADFRGAVFREYADFTKAKFFNKVDFSQAVFENGVSFEGAKFETQGEDVLFEETIFLPSENDINFSKAQFGNKIHREFGDNEIWFVREENHYSLFSRDIHEKIDFPKSETKTLGKFRNEQDLENLLISQGREEYRSGIEGCFKRLKKNPGQVSFSHAIFCNLDFAKFSDKDIKIALDIERERLKHLVFFDKYIAKFRKLELELKKTSNQSNELESDLKIILLNILSRNISREVFRNKRVGNVEQSIHFEQVGFNNIGDVDFDFVTFGNGKSVFFKSVVFRNGGVISFESATFVNESEVNFDSAIFRNGRGVSFRSAEFKNQDWVSFRDTKFSNDGKVAFTFAGFRNGCTTSTESKWVDFRKAIFQNDGGVDFTSVVFSNGGRVTFWNALFRNRKWVNFEGAVFSNDGDIDFGPVTFNNNGDLNFRSTIFCNTSDVNFKNAMFVNKGILYFDKIVWGNWGALYWDGILFKETTAVKFDECLFLPQGDISFKEAHFPKEGSLMFQRCYFARTSKVNFTGTFFRHATFEGGPISWLKDRSDLTLKILLEKQKENAWEKISHKAKNRIEVISFSIQDSDTKSSPVFAKGVEVLWKDLTTESARNLTFRLTNFSDSKFDGVTLSHIQLNAPIWAEVQGREGLFEEKEFRNSKVPPTQDQLRNIGDQYTQLKNNLERQGNYTEAGKFHFAEQEIKYEKMKLYEKNWFNKFLTYCYFFLSGYGERPPQAFFMLIFFLLIAVIVLSFNAVFSFGVFWLAFMDFQEILGLMWKNYVIKAVFDLVTPFSWKTLLTSGLNTNWYLFSLIIFQFFLLGIQLPLTVMAIRRRFKR